MLRRLAVNLLLLAGSSILSVFLAEGVVRVAAPQPEVPQWYIPDTQLGHVLKPNLHQRCGIGTPVFTMDVRTNSYGLRDIEQDYASRAPGKTILLIGDSFVFGYGVNVEDRLDAALRAKFATAATPVRVIDAGVPGWGTIQEVTFTKSKLETFRPDIIVLVYCGNDQQDDRAMLNGAGNLLDGGIVRFPGKPWLREHSHLYRLIFYETWSWRHAIGARTQMRAGPEARIDSQSVSVLTDEGWARAETLMHDLVDAFHRQNPAGVLYLAATAPWDEDLSKHLAAMADGKAIRFIDLVKEARAIPPKERRLPYDPHWGPRMHLFMADNIYKALSTD